jgi:hypothetical protein
MWREFRHCEECNPESRMGCRVALHEQYFRWLRRRVERFWIASARNPSNDGAVKPS